MDTFLTIGMITRQALASFENELDFTMCVDRKYDDQFARSGAKIGDVLNVRLPVQFVPASGQGIILQDLTESSVPVVLNKQYQRSFAVTSADLSLNIDDFNSRFVKKAVLSLANEIDFDGMGQYVNLYNEVGTPGTIPATSNIYLNAGQRLDEEAAPMGDRNVVINPAMQATIIPALQGLFNPQTTISGQFRKGRMSKDTLGFDWYMDQNARIQTVGPLGGTPLVDGANQTGSSILTKGWTSAVAKRLNKGDVFTLGSGTTGVYAVNPQNLQSTGALRQFVVTADTSSTSGGAATIPIYPSIVTTGPYATVTVSPADNAAVTVNGAANTVSGRGIAFTPECFTFVTADLPRYGGLDMCDRMTDDQIKISMRVIRDYDINLDRAPLRIDCLGGWATIRPQLGVRIAS